MMLVPDEPWRRLREFTDARIGMGRVGNGLPSAAVHTSAAAMLAATIGHLDDWQIGPPVIASQTRVALADDIGDRMGAGLSVILIGERPGQSSPASLSAYLTWQPRVGRQNHQRNCISNIRPDGCPVDVAALRLATLMKLSRRRQLSGVVLKEGSRDLATPTP